MTETPTALRKRVIVTLGPTEDPGTYEATPVPQVNNLANGIILVRVEPNYITGLWMAVLDVTDAPDQEQIPWWAPGVTPPVLLPRANVEAAAKANTRPRLELLR